MGDGARGYVGLDAGATYVIPTTPTPSQQWGFSSTARVGGDFRLTQESTRPLLIVEGTGLLHIGPSTRVGAGALQLGLGLETKGFFLRALGGPLFYGGTPLGWIGGLGRAELGFHVGPHVAITTGLLFAGLPDSASSSSSRDKTECSLEYPYLCDTKTITTTSRHDAFAIGFNLGIQVFFGSPNF